MPPAARLGDIGSGHGCFPPSPAIAGSPDVFINGKPAVRLGDPYAPHGCGNCPPHPRSLAAGSATVFINGKAAGRVGDAIGCGGTAAAGSGDVLIGDVGLSGPLEPCMAAARASIAAFVSMVPPDVFDEQVKAVVSAGGDALARHPFFIEAPNGRKISGYTDGDGKLPRIRTPEADQLVIYWGDAALAKMEEAESGPPAR